MIILQLLETIANLDFTDILLNGSVTSLMVIYAYFVMERVLKEKKQDTRKLETAKKKFFKVMEDGLRTNVINTIEDVDNIYIGAGGSRSDDISYRFKISKWLKEFLVEIISKEKDESISNEILSDWKQKISDFITKIEEISPYSGLPETERNILTDIISFLESGNNDGIERKLSEVSGILQARNDDLNRIRNTNKWAVPLAVIGMILTVIFGLMSILT